MRLYILLNVIIITAGGLLTPLWGKFVAEIGGDTRTAGIAIAIFSIVIGLLTMVMAKIEEHYHIEKSALIISTFLIVIAYSGYFFVKNPAGLYLVQALLGFSSSIQTPAIFALYQRSMKQKHTTWGWGLWNGMYFIATGFAALAAAFLAHHFGMFAVFTFMLILTLISLVLSIYIVMKSAEIMP